MKQEKKKTKQIVIETIVPFMHLKKCTSASLPNLHECVYTIQQDLLLGYNEMLTIGLDVEKTSIK